MDWHASVYGSRNGGSGRYRSGDYPEDDFDDGVTYGSSAIVPDNMLRMRGGSAYYRAYEVIDSGRLRNLQAWHEGRSVLALSAEVEGRGEFDDRYETTTTVDEDAGTIERANCTCPAFAGNASICKHVIALIMHYNESPQLFLELGHRREHTARQHTSNALRVFMRREQEEQRRHAQQRELALLKEVDAHRVQQRGDGQTTVAHMPIGSVTLRPCIESTPQGWHSRFRLTIPTQGVTYVVKDVPALVRAVREREYVAYGKRLAFVHSRDAFDTRSQAVLDVLDRAVRIRQVLHAGGASAGIQHGEMVLSEDEIGELLNAYVGEDATLDYARPNGYSLAAEPANVIDGDPDLGLSIDRVPRRPGHVPPVPGSDGMDDTDAGAAEDFVIHHRWCVERFIVGSAASFVVVHPVDAASAADFGHPVIHRCSRRFASQRKAIMALCGGDDPDGEFLAASDVDAFSHTVLPLMMPTDGGASAVGDRGLKAVLPEELLRLRRPPCVIESYLDRGKDGVTCDIQARYGERRFHVFAGIEARNPSGRDRDAERLAVEAVRHYFPVPQGDVAVIPESDDEAIYRLLTEGLPVLRGLGDVFSTPAFDGLTPSAKVTVRLGLSVESGLVEISPIADEIDPQDVPALLEGYHDRRRFHRLRNGAFVDLRHVDATAVEQVTSDLGLRVSDVVSGPVRVPEFAAYYLDQEVDDVDKAPSFTKYLDGLRVIDPQAYEVPPVFDGVLRPYQVEGFRWLSAVCDKGFGGILADEMGLGKTVQMLALLQSRLRESRTVGPSLIVCPASLVYNWQAESERFAPQLRVAVVAGGKGERKALLERVRLAQGSSSDATATGERADERDYDLLITSYDLLRRDVDEYQGITLYCATLDEAQYIKNHATQSAKAVRSLDARHRFALTGTPIENRLSELWSIFDFLMPGMLGPYAHFRERFEMPVLSGDVRTQGRLQALVGPFILRRLKSDVLADLPEKIENVVAVPLRGEQRRLYAALEQRLRATLNKQRDFDFATGKILVLAQLTKLRQVCCDPRLLYSDAKAGSAKLDAIVELVSSCRDAGRKMLIFSQFTSYLDLIAQRLRADGVAYDVITGATAKKKRLQLVDQFNADSTPVFLISLKAGNTGLNLTGACVVVHADPWWNAAAQNQATDRAHRIGQTQDVNVYQIVAKDTIEERILALQRTKSDLASRFVDSAAGGSIASLTKDDLISLLG